MKKMFPIHVPSISYDRLAGDGSLWPINNEWAHLDLHWKL
jgi:hypothetical protein